VDLSTISYNATVEISRALDAKGVAFLDAPVSGMEARAIEGTLTVMCGGERAVFDRVIRTPAEGVGRDSRRLGLRIDGSTMSRGGEPWRMWRII
jgi:3-hydroxyisobutyrate dehydrogenase-like beta-hydroxyacid dehydrogenase